MYIFVNIYFLNPKYKCNSKSNYKYKCKYKSNPKSKSKI